MSIFSFACILVPNPCVRSSVDTFLCKTKGFLFERKEEIVLYFLVTNGSLSKALLLPFSNIDQKTKAKLKPIHPLGFNIIT